MGKVGVALSCEGLEAKHSLYKSGVGDRLKQPFQRCSTLQIVETHGDDLAERWIALLGTHASHQGGEQG